MANTFVCTQCGNIDTQRLAVKGSGFIEILLWLFIFPIGIIYSIWRRTGKKNACLKCKSEQVIPIDSPQGKRILSETGSGIEEYVEEEKRQEVVKEKKARNESKVAWTVLIVFLVLILILIVGSAL